MNAQEIISSGILELYCTGLASVEETAQVQQWARQYPEVAAEIDAIQAGLEGYARAHAIKPSASVKEKIFDEINKTAPSLVVNMDKAPARSISSAWRFAAAASIILLLGSLFFNYILYSKYQTINGSLQVAQSELKEQKDMAESMDTAMRVMGDMHAVPVAVKSTDTTSDMGAKIYWMKNTNEVYIDPANLPKAPVGKQYEFWAIVDGVPVNGGVITAVVNGKKVHIQKMKSFGKVQAFAISLEDAGAAKTKPDKVMAVGTI